MEIRKMAELYALYPEAQQGIMYDSPEILLMKCISENNADGAAALFRDRRQFSDARPRLTRLTAGLREKTGSVLLRRGLFPDLKPGRSALCRSSRPGAAAVP